MARIFTVEEANALVPSLQLAWARIFRLRDEVERLLDLLGDGDPSQAMAMIQEEVELPAELVPEVERARTLLGELGAAVQGLNDAGCLVKDLELGLVDFHAVRDGRPVFLCWQYGEPGVLFWHPQDEGFRSRRPLSATAPPLH